MSEKQGSSSWREYSKKILTELAPVIHFAVHIFVGTAIFILIAMAAVGLDFLLKKLANYEISDVILRGLTIAKIIIFAADMILFFVFVVNTSWNFIYSMKWNGGYTNCGRNNNT